MKTNRKEKTLFYNATVITMNTNNDIYDSVYVEDGIIKDVGFYDAMKDKYKDSNITKIDLKGHALMPGFIEPHAHFDLCSMVSQMASVSGIEFETSENVVKQLKKVIKETPKGKWIMCFGLDYLINPDLPVVSRYDLDKLTSDHPVTIIIQSMHTIFCNSLALKLAGITKDTKDTRDGHCLKDENGEPTGVLTEQSFLIPFVKLWLKDLHKDPIEMLKEEVMLWKKLGVTTTWTAGYFSIYPDHFNLMNKFFNDPNTPLRGDYALSFNSVESGHISDADLHIKPTKKVHFTGIKAWYDGSPYTGNTFMYENYLENPIMQGKLFIPPNQHGERLFTQDFFYDMIKKYHKEGYQLSIHAQGNKAAHEVIEMLDKLLKECPRKDHQHRLEHCAFIDKKDLKKAGELGLTISFHVNHLYYYGEALEELVVGKKIAYDMLPCKSALNNGIRISLHSDAPMYSPNPLRVAYGAITRKTRSGLLINPDECITITEALRGITIDAAYQLHRDKELGSIEVGKLADFTILEENPYEVDVDHIKDIKVVTTYLSGRDTDEMKW